MSGLTELYKEIAACRQCEIAKLRTKVVPGEGTENAEILFIGEAPGFHEDQQGRPFVGPAGQFLDKLLASIGLKRQQVYIANVIKCRPPNNREPSSVEIENCRNFLDRQIEQIHPKIIVTLGRYSMARFFPGKSISKIHGTAQRQNGVVYFAMYHPAAALHQQNLRETIEADMLKIPQYLAEIKEIPEEKIEPPQSEQLKMF
ncbi:MAG: uracil-DNA glycosylase [Dehalococcoidales bacterium]|nr:uracil-DNA glycosylase [Dehalococcoidales bacterium]